MIKAVIFDMDGTLIDSKELWFRAVTEGVKKVCGKEIDYTEFVENIWEKSLYKYLPFILKEKSEKALHEIHRTVVRISTTKMPLFENEIEVLTDLKKKYDLAIATNISLKPALKVLETTGLSQYFEVVVGGDMVENIKPDPEILFLACENLGVETKDAVYVGDTKDDAVAGNNAGIRTIAFKVNSQEAGAHADSFHEIESILSEWDK